MRRKLIAALASLLIMGAMLAPASAQYEGKPRCWAVDDVCQVRADTVWNNCRADGGWYIVCYIEYSATYDDCMSSQGCSGQAAPRNE